jgi:hypothetical protein
MRRSPTTLRQWLRPICVAIRGLPGAMPRQTSSTRQCRTNRSDGEQPGPWQPSLQQSDPEIRQPGADAESGGVECGAPRLYGDRQPIRQRLEARHVGPGQAQAGQPPPAQAARQTVGEAREAGQRERAHGRAGQVDAPRVDAIGQADQYGYGEDVAEEKDAAQPAACGRRQDQRCESCGNSDGTSAKPAISNASAMQKVSTSAAEERSPAIIPLQADLVMGQPACLPSAASAHGARAVGQECAPPRNR